MTAPPPLTLAEHRRQPVKPLPLAKTLPLNVGALHFVGIGGIGMSGIAEVLHNLGYTVQGSDLSSNANTERLKKMGVNVIEGHREENIEKAAVVVISSAVKHTNPEVAAAREKRIPVVRRAEMLAEIMRLKMSIAIAGTHGKTTTTALTAELFEVAGRKPTVINGGIINARGTNAYLGSGEWMIVEADESDGTFMRVPSTIGVITNIDPEHLEHYGSFDGVRAAFHTFITNLPFYGFAVLCLDHPEVQSLLTKITDRRIITYGLSAQADVRAVNITHTQTGQKFDIEVTNRENSRTIKDVELAMRGSHNIRNALAAVSIAIEMGFDDEVIKTAYKNFKGVNRRFTQTGTAHDMMIIDDYGHHPVEIEATLKAARDAQNHLGGRVVAVVQPHRYSRLHDLFDTFCTCFNDADVVIVTDVYSAGEEPIEGADAPSLIEGLKRAGHKNVFHAPSDEELPGVILQHARPKDMVVCLGAGSISKWANALPEQLKQLSPKAAK